MVFNSRSYISGEKKHELNADWQKFWFYFEESKQTNKQTKTNSNHLNILYRLLQVPNCYSPGVGVIPRVELKRLRWLSLNRPRFGVVCLKNKSKVFWETFTNNNNKKKYYLKGKAFIVHRNSNTVTRNFPHLHIRKTITKKRELSRSFLSNLAIRIKKKAKFSCLKDNFKRSYSIQNSI